MELTPLEQVVFAVATYETGELTVEPLFGLVTVTLAKAGSAQSNSAQAREGRVFMSQL
jgi:hypothetical protein